MGNETKRRGRPIGSGVPGVRHTIRLSPEVDALLKAQLPVGTDQRGAMKKFIEDAIREKAERNRK